jgi:hypothetical protein
VSQPAPPLCAAFGCAEPVQAVRGPSPFCAPHTGVIYEFSLWLEGRGPERPGWPEGCPFASFDIARRMWGEGRSNLTSVA